MDKKISSNQPKYLSTPSCVLQERTWARDARIRQGSTVPSTTPSASKPSLIQMSQGQLEYAPQRPRPFKHDPHHHHSPAPSPEKSKLPIPKAKYVKAKSMPRSSAPDAKTTSSCKKRAPLLNTSPPRPFKTTDPFLKKVLGMKR